MGFWHVDDLNLSLGHFWCRQIFFETMYPVLLVKDFDFIGELAFDALW